ncbi:exported protein of unknown function [Xenorhabdus poinarii G6]|uniref:Uncharacterized protein n=1 Tax=Xenorhabdus poinarii G6 TaxID=1354304 RepID=A0A068R197_9GAMM|nr:hypothetical protein [Xenorhabdus poinarii]CDG20794.1 exported protein of unknown function [Xenorhabdus poinarii G6]
MKRVAIKNKFLDEVAILLLFANLNAYSSSALAAEQRDTEGREAVIEGRA